MRFQHSLFLILLSAATSAGAQSAPDAATQTLSAFHAAMQRGDGEAVLALLDPAVSIFESGVAETREQYRSHHLAGDMAFSQATQSRTRKQEVDCTGSICIVTRQTETSGSFKGKSVNLAGTETAVLKRVGEAWKIVHLHWSSKKN